MTTPRNRQVFLRSRPNGIPDAEDFGIRDGLVPELAEGEILVRNRYLSADPAMRGWITDASNYWPQIQVGDTMRAFAAGEIVASNDPAYAVGERLMGIFGWQDYSAITAHNILARIDYDDIPLSASLGVLGLNGVTAYFGLLSICEPKAGETVVVSTAAGGVGSAAGQIAKIKGCRTVGIAGGPEKVRQCIEEFGYDAAIDYKAGGDFDAALRAAAPDGVDVYFDNTSGWISDTVISQINLNARIAICGTASYPGWDPWNQGPRPERHLLVKRAKMHGFLATDFSSDYPRAIAELAGWIRESKLRYREDLFEGIEHAPGSLKKLYSGENNGKLVIKIAD